MLKCQTEQWLRFIFSATINRIIVIDMAELLPFKNGRGI